jgi:hypothetical protein
MLFVLTQEGEMVKSKMDKKNLIAQWAFDTSSILGRFHLWLEDVDVEWLDDIHPFKQNSCISFVGDAMEKMFVTTTAVTSLGTRLFGRFGEGRGLSKAEINRVKKDADAISAYAMSESLWFLSRFLPENHSIMVSLGEGLMPKAGETPEMGSNPLLGFGRVYARPQVARFLDSCVYKLINNEDYRWEDFYNDIRNAGITVWGTAVDTLENTSRFAKGDPTGAITVLHVFDQPLSICKTYEGYMGNLILPEEIVAKAAEESLLIDYFTPRSKLLYAIKKTYPGIKSENVHIWTLRGKSREHRIGKLWKEWISLGVHLVDDGWELPNGKLAFTESGTYAPTYSIGTWKDENDDLHLFIVDGYAASAEAMQAASLSTIRNLNASLVVFSSKFKISYDEELRIMKLNAEGPEFERKARDINNLDRNLIESYRRDILEAKTAGLNFEKRTIKADDFFPEKLWKVMALSGYMLPDPYSGFPGVEKVKDKIYRVTSRITTAKGDKKITLTFRLLESLDESRLIFSPLLNRFMQGEDYQSRPVKISDSGRIRNELQTLCSEALEYFGNGKIRVNFDRIPEDVIPLDKQVILYKVLNWYKENHPIWFKWLDIMNS